MTRLTIFYFLNWFALLVYIFNGSIYLSRGDMGAFQILMAFNTSLFLVIVIKAVTKGISKLFQSDEYEYPQTTWPDGNYLQDESIEYLN